MYFSVLSTPRELVTSGRTSETWNISGRTRVTMHGPCHDWLWLIQFSGTVRTCFTLSCSTIFTEIPPIKLKDSYTYPARSRQFNVIGYVRIIFNCSKANLISCTAKRKGKSLNRNDFHCLNVTVRPLLSVSLHRLLTVSETVIT